MSDHAILPKEHVDTNDGKDYHIFKIKSKNKNSNGTINIEIEKCSECGLEAKKFNFYNLSMSNFIVK